MTFLSPWAFAIVAAAVAGTVLLHLVARQHPATYLLPTARFIPDRRSLVSRVTTRPRDLALLALRVLLLLAAGTAFARPVLTGSRVPLARVILLDVSRAQESLPDAAARARAATSAGVPTTVIVFDTVATTIALTATDSVVRVGARAPGSLSVGLIAARRAAAVLAESADAVELVLVSPLATSELDGATATLRRQWPGVIRIERTALRADSSTEWRMERSVPLADPLGPSLVDVPAGGAGATVRLVRAALAASDSMFAQLGGTVVRWDSTRTTPLAAEGLAVGIAVIVAPLGRAPLLGGEGEGVRTVARWADGEAAAVESSHGAGCVRHVGVILPARGDLPLHPPFQQMVRALVSPCDVVSPERALDSADVALLMGGDGAARAEAFGLAPAPPSTLARWLLAVALGLAFAEVVVRARTPRQSHA